MLKVVWICNYKGMFFILLIDGDFFYVLGMICLLIVFFGLCILWFVMFC